MICPVCGTNNRDTAVKCIKCGLILTPGKVAKQRQTETEDDRWKMKKKPSILARSYPSSLSNGRYIVEKKLGSGGMSRVFLAKDQKMDCYVVVKELLPLYDDEKEAEYLENRFREEAKLLYRLDHSGLPKVTDYFTEEDRLYFIMRYIDGETLASIVEKRPNHQITIEECLKWMNSIIDILIYLHNQDPPVIHRDIKPHNLMVDKNGNIFLVDFGIAREMREHSSTSTSVGTFGYASPENFTGKFVFSSDLYSLGATFHMLLTGKDPRERPPFTFPPLSTYRSDIPPRLDEIFAKLLENETEKRYQNAEELKKDFTEFIESYHRQKDIKKEKIVIEGIAGDRPIKLSMDSPIKLSKEGLARQPKESFSSSLGQEAIPEAKEEALRVLPIPAREPSSTEDTESEKPLRPLFAPRSRQLSRQSFSEEHTTTENEPKIPEPIPIPVISKDKEEEEGALVSMEIKPARKPILPVLLVYTLVLIALVGVFFFLTTYILKVPIINVVGQENKYSLKIYANTEDTKNKVNEILSKTKYKSTVSKVQRTSKTRAKGYQVIQVFDTPDQASSFSRILSIKGFTSKTFNAPGEGVIVQVGNVFSNKKDAERFSAQIKQVANLATTVDYHYERKPYTSYLFSVSEVPSKDEALRLKTEISKITPEVEILPKVDK